MQILCWKSEPEILRENIDTKSTFLVSSYIFRYRNGSSDYKIAKMKKSPTPNPAAKVTAPQAPAPVGQPKPVGVPTATPKPGVAAPVSGVPHKQVNTANAATAGAGNSTGNKVGVIEPPTLLIRSNKSTPSVSSLKSNQSNASVQPMQRSKSQTVDRAHTRMGSVANKRPPSDTHTRLVLDSDLEDPWLERVFINS